MKFTHLIPLALASISSLWGQAEAEKASVTTTLDKKGHSIVVEARGVQPKAPLFYSISVEAGARFSPERLREWAHLEFKIQQGEADQLSLEMLGWVDVLKVEGESLKSWSVRKEDGRRYLDLIPKITKGIKDLKAMVYLERKDFKFPLTTQATTYGPAEKNVGFSAKYSFTSVGGLAHRLISANGAMHLDSDDDTVDELTSTRRSELKVEIFREASRPLPVELTNATLEGQLDAEGSSAMFRLKGLIRVTATEPVSFDILSGQAAPTSQVGGDKMRLVLDSSDDPPVYRLHFTAAGEYPIDLSFVAPISGQGGSKNFSFFVPSGAVVPVTLKGVADSSDFLPVSTIQPTWTNEGWRGFLPATGYCAFVWEPKRTRGDGKLFFTSESMSDLAVGAGLVRQSTELRLKTLQGSLPSLKLKLDGTGEILAVEGGDVLSWKVDKGILDITLSRPVTDEASFLIRSQAALNVLPSQIEPLRITPQGAVRHSGYLRVYNNGAVRLEVMKTKGLAQLSPDQFPESSQLREGQRQVFYYRFPSAERSYIVAAERVKPEINLSQLLSYELTETDRVLRADLELDIREAGIREFEFYAPADYSPVAITAASFADYVASAPESGRRRIKVLFEKEILGKHLVQVHLEKNSPAKAGPWQLPTLTFPGAKFTRGELGVSAAPGYRVSAGKVTGLGEMPLIHFQKPNPRLQLAYRIRSDEWQGNLNVEVLSQNVQTDVFHLYSLKENTAYVSVLVNYFVTGSPSSEWTLTVPEGAEHLNVDGRDVRDSQVVDGILSVPLHRPVMGAYQLLVTYEQKSEAAISMAGLTPQNVQGERGFVQVVSPGQVELKDVSMSKHLIKLDPLELPAEYRLMSHAPSLAAWQYTARPISLTANVSWFERGEMARQVVEYADLSSRIARDGGVVTDSTFQVRTRGERSLLMSVPQGVSIRSVSVDGKPVTIREADDQRLIPLPDTVTPNEPVRVEVRSSNTGNGDEVRVLAPTIAGTTQLLTKWQILADSGYVLDPLNSGRLELITKYSRESGFKWIERNSLLSFTLVLLGWAAGWGMMRGNRGVISFVGALIIFAASVGGFSLAKNSFTSVRVAPTELFYSVPVLAPGNPLMVVVNHHEAGSILRSDFGLQLSMIGVIALVCAWKFPAMRLLLIIVGMITIAIGTLSYADGAGWFFIVLGLVILWSLWSLSSSRLDEWCDLFRKNDKEEDLEDDDDESEPSPSGGMIAAIALALTLTLGLVQDASATVVEIEEPTWPAVDSLSETWTIKDERLTSVGIVTITGKVGEQFLLLSSPGVLTEFKGEGLKVTTKDAGYFITPTLEGTHQATFSYQMTVAEVTKGINILTGVAAVRSIDVRYEAAGWDIQSSLAVQRIVQKSDQGSAAKLWLRPLRGGLVVLRPKARDVSAEASRFFAEVSQVFIPGPGVVDGIHQISIRPSQGEVKELVLTVPEDFTVSEVRSSVVGPWRFDPEKRLLKIEVTPNQSRPFDLIVETQRSLATLPSSFTVEPMRVVGASGEVGMIALAFGDEAQLDKETPAGLSLVNLTDFDSRLIPAVREGKKRAALQKVYRYSKAKASLKVDVAPVAPEVRVSSNQKLSLGDERTVLAIDFVAAITRAGVFRLSFPIPDGFEVESFTGGALNHWVESTEDKERMILMNLNGKTLGAQKFSIVLTGPSAFIPSESWAVPKFRLREATRQSGQLVLVPGRGIQLRVTERKDVSALDPRSIGGNQPGSLAFRLLQDSWSLGLAINQLEPSIAARLLHDIELREGRSRSRIDFRLQIDQASIRTLRLFFPGLSELDAQTLRASGSEVRDIVKVADLPEAWDLQFKRRVTGETTVRIEFEQNNQDDSSVRIDSCEVEAARQQESFLALRPGVRLELSTQDSEGWASIDWAALPKSLRQADRSGVPAALFRTMRKDRPVVVALKRHAVASGTKLRVKSGRLLSVVSPGGELMSQADLVIEALQRGPLDLVLPKGSRLFGVFVNEESALVVKKGDGYVFNVSGDAGTIEAKVRVSYATTLQKDSLSDFELEAFRVGEPLENVTWTIVVPEQYRLRHSEGDLDVLDYGEPGSVSIGEYLSLVTSRNNSKAEGARTRLGQVTNFLQSGDQGKAAMTLEQVYNGNALDAASNEDARVKLENLVTQQAVVGLNTRRQRLYLDNRAQVDQGDLNDQIEVAANANPVFSGNLNYDKDDFANVTLGNNIQVNRMLNTIATKWIKHQRVTEPVPQLLDPVISSSGRSIVFEREIQVSGEKPLQLELEFEKKGGQSNSLTTVWLFILLVLSFFLIWKATMAKS